MQSSNVWRWRYTLQPTTKTLHRHVEFSYHSSYFRTEIFCKMINSLINACLNFCTVERHIDEVIDFIMNRDKILKKSVAWLKLSHDCAALNPAFSARHSSTGIFIYHVISFLISRVIVICFKIKWASNILEAWLCSSFFISKIEESTFLSSNFAMMKKEHFICLLESCRRIFFARSWDFRSRSQIIHVLHITFNLNFFIRFSIIA